MFSPVFAFHASGRFCPSTTPDAFGPRNDGQLPAAAAGFGRDGWRACEVRIKFRAGLLTASPAGDQVLRSRIIWRGRHSSATRSNVRRLPSPVIRYLPGPSQPPGPPPAIESSISAPCLFQLPLSLGQPLPSRVKAPDGSKRATKAPNDNGWEG